MQTFNYSSIDSINEAVASPITWEEEKIEEREVKFKALYPWRQK
jgi:hypothetical protein